jgi:hypothetical protein
MLYNIPYPHIQRGYKLGEQYDDCPWERRNLQLFALFNLSVISVHFFTNKLQGSEGYWQWSQKYLRLLLLGGCFKIRPPKTKVNSCKLPQFIRVPLIR